MGDYVISHAGLAIHKVDEAGPRTASRCSRTSSRVTCEFIDEYRDPSLAGGSGARSMHAPQRSAGRSPSWRSAAATPMPSAATDPEHAPESLGLVSGPGAGVRNLGARHRPALFLAGRDQVIFATFGNMLRVPARAAAAAEDQGRRADVRVVSSASECVPIAQAHPDGRSCSWASGSRPHAHGRSMVRTARGLGVDNLSIFSAHKVIPPRSGPCSTTRTWRSTPSSARAREHHHRTHAYDEIPLKGRAAVITGFEPVDILAGIYMILGQILKHDYSVEISIQEA